VARTRAKKPKAPPNAGRASKTSSAKTAPPVVLVVEDEPTVRTLAESTIAEHGYATLSAANGTEALALLNDGAPIDLLFTDINMPDGPDGLELARQAVELRPGLRVLYTSGGGQTDGMIARFVEGGRFLVKPYTNEQLIEAVRMADHPA
jgi:CheY-like chemotaxis protein